MGLTNYNLQMELASTTIGTQHIFADIMFQQFLLFSFNFVCFSIYFYLKIISIDLSIGGSLAFPTITLVFLYFTQENPQHTLYKYSNKPIETHQAWQTMPRYILNPFNKGHFLQKPARIYPQSNGTTFPHIFPIYYVFVH